VYQFETPDVLAREGIDVVYRAARFVDSSMIVAGDRTIQSKAFLLTSEMLPFIPYEQIFDNDVRPRTMLIVGVGPIGIEMAQAYPRLGSQVTVVGKAALPQEDPEAQNLIKTVLEGEGVHFVQESAKEVRRNGNSVVITTEHQELNGDLLLVAAGRKPNIEGLDLENRCASRWRLGSGVNSTDVTAKVVIYEVFVEGKLEAPRHLARRAHDLYFEPKYEEFRSRTIQQ